MSIKNVSTAISLAACAVAVASLVSIVNRPPLSFPADRLQVSSVSEQVPASDRRPVVFAEQGTGNCVAAFRRGTESDWNGITGVSCLAIATERKNQKVVEKTVPKGTTFAQVLEQFLYSDPWKDEFLVIGPADGS